jgi:hypothetical protein
MHYVPTTHSYHIRTKGAYFGKHVAVISDSEYKKMYITCTIPTLCDDYLKGSGTACDVMYVLYQKAIQLVLSLYITGKWSE